MAARHSWTTLDNILLLLVLSSEDGEGATGQTPQLTISRHRAVRGPMLDGYYWDGSAFVSSPYFHDLLEVDAINQPGLYRYIFQQSEIALEQEYLVRFSNAGDPKGFDVEVHTVLDDSFRALGLLHNNALVDRQLYDQYSQLTGARIRVFDTAAHVPATPGGGETIGLVHEYEVEAEWSGPGIATSYAVRKVQ